MNYSQLHSGGDTWSKNESLAQQRYAKWKGLENGSNKLIKTRRKWQRIYKAANINVNFNYSVFEVKGTIRVCTFAYEIHDLLNFLH
jgi:hypothetical protein